MYVPCDNDRWHGDEMYKEPGYEPDPDFLRDEQFQEEYDA